MDLRTTKTLHNGYEMPQLGLGVWKADNDTEVVNAVKWAVDKGYKAIDTAAIYKNEEGVGKALKEIDVPREELFITTKVWNDDQGYDATRRAFEASLQRLDTSYVNLYLIHWPVAGKYQETWRAMEDLYSEGKVKAIGVSNFHPHHLDRLLSTAKIVPMVNQIELHPLLNQEALREYCQKKDILVEAWSPLGGGKLLQNETLQAIGKKYGKSVAQVILRWDIQHGIITIPKSVTQHRIEENAEIFDFSLTQEDMATIDAMNTNERFGTNPNEFDE